ncbi:uncharacterized [Tachysurus ichikawai]
MCREWLEHARSDSNKWHVSIRNGEELRNVVLTSPAQPGGIPSGARGRGGTIKIPTPHARQNVKRAWSHCPKIASFCRAKLRFRGCLRKYLLLSL